jgi:hypothetical protein
MTPKSLVSGELLPSQHSTVKEFKSFQDSISHPLFRLGIAEAVNSVTGIDFDQNPFKQLSDEVIECLTGLECAVEDILQWNSDLDKADIPSFIKLDAFILFSKLFRWYCFFISI